MERGRRGSGFRYLLHDSLATFDSIPAPIAELPLVVNRVAMPYDIGIPPHAFRAYAEENQHE